MDWVEYFARLLDVLKLKSQDPSTKVAAIITINNAIVSTGFNGFPIGVKDDPERYENRELKYQLIVHAEHNAILLASRQGKSLEGSSLWVNKFPCCECAKAIIQSGIKTINIIEWKEDPEFDLRWEKSLSIAKMMFRESDTIVERWIWDGKEF
jgi:dCMP deaminase